MRGALRAAALLSLVLAGPAGAGVTGRVFVDLDGDGARGPDEPGLPGVVVTDGVAVVRSDADGRYRLPGAGRFVVLTRPAGFACEHWYREGSGDFALRPVAAASAFFFIQISDSHVYDRVSDFADYSSLQIPWFVPQIVVDWLTVRVLRRGYGDDVLEKLRQELAPYREVSALSDLEIYAAYREEFARPEGPLGRVVEETRAAFREVADLRPEFVIATGDLVLESNMAPAEPIERWFRFYRELAGTLGVPVYNTIGNNEIAGIQYDEFPASDARHGKQIFRSFFGPTYYSFDRGPYHFVALDTHRPAEGDPDGDWTFSRMPEPVRAWLDADLSAHADRVPVVLNHEPFHFDPAWPFDPDPDQTADDEGLFAAHGVRYVLSGHTHLNSFVRENDVIHLTTGALSGFRWVLPVSVHERGYRLFYAKDGELYSAWKPTGEWRIATAEGAERPGNKVLVAVDRRAAFASLEVTRGGVAVPFERLGEFFASLPRDPASSAPLVVVATRADGTRERVELSP